MLEDWITETGRVSRTLRLDGAKEFVGSEMRDFCRKHNITLQLVPAYNHLLQCRVEGAIRITKSHTRVALKQSGCPLRPPTMLDEHGRRPANAVARSQRQQLQERPEGDRPLGYPSPAEDRNRKRREDYHDAAGVRTSHR